MFPPLLPGLLVVGFGVFGVAVVVELLPPPHLIRTSVSSRIQRARARG
jgi:hypothetical protein